MADRRRLNPAVWTVLGGILGVALGYDWSAPMSLAVKLDILILGLLAGGFVTAIVAAWPRLRTVPDVACPRCGHRMKWDVVVCSECGEIR